MGLPGELLVGEVAKCRRHDLDRHHSVVTLVVEDGNEPSQLQLALTGKRPTMQHLVRQVVGLEGGMVRELDERHLADRQLLQIGPLTRPMEEVPGVDDHPGVRELSAAEDCTSCFYVADRQVRKELEANPEPLWEAGHRGPVIGHGAVRRLAGKPRHQVVGLQHIDQGGELVRLGQGGPLVFGHHHRLKLHTAHPLLRDGLGQLLHRPPLRTMPTQGPYVDAEPIEAGGRGRPHLGDELDRPVLDERRPLDRLVAERPHQSP